MIFFTKAIMASEFPHVSSKPSVSFIFIRPFSKHSIAKAIVDPVDIVSIAARLHKSLISSIESKSLLRRSAPNEQQVSYSGR